MKTRGRAKPFGDCFAFAAPGLVNGEDLTDGPAKLRWPSIKRVLLPDDLILIHHEGGEAHLFVVDDQKGVPGRIKKSRFPGAGGDFDGREGQLILSQGTRVEAIGLDAVKGTLK